MKTSYRLAVIGAVAASVAVRVRFLFEPQLPDEGGILAVARSWSSGANLYETAWIDRPQGLILLFRGWDALPATGPSSVRMLAVLFGAAAIVALASIGRSLFNPHVGARTAWFAAALTAAPLLDGFAANSGLLSISFAVSGLAVSAAVIARRCSMAWLLLAGVLFGSGLAIKQSAFDPLLAVLAWFALAWLFRWQQRPRAIASAALVGVGTAAVLAACAVHGSTLGWSDYWYAVAGFRLDERSGLANPELDKLAVSLLFVGGVLIPAALLLVRAYRHLGPRSLPRRPHATLVILWALASSFAFVTGGSFHRHYFLILAFPLALIASLATSKLAQRGGKHALAAVAIAFASALPFVAHPRLILGDISYTNLELSQWVDEQQAGRGPVTVYAYCADAALYPLLDQAPPFRYLWEDHVRLADGAQDGLLALLDGPDAPDFVLRVQPLEQCDESQLLTPAIERRYVSDGRIGPVEVLRRSDLPATAG